LKSIKPRWYTDKQQKTRESNTFFPCEACLSDFNARRSDSGPVPMQIWLCISGELPVMSRLLLDHTLGSKGLIHDSFQCRLFHQPQISCKLYWRLFLCSFTYHSKMCWQCTVWLLCSAPGTWTPQLQTWSAQLSPMSPSTNLPPAVSCLPKWGRHRTSSFNQSMYLQFKIIQIMTHRK
jgi:hypothetical protein